MLCTPQMSTIDPDFPGSLVSARRSGAVELGARAASAMRVLFLSAALNQGGRARAQSCIREAVPTMAQ
jgi:hypothetical protein